MRDILKLYSGTHSGTPFLIQKIANFGQKRRGGKNLEKIHA